MLERPWAAFAFALVDTLERLCLDPMAFLIPKCDYLLHAWRGVQVYDNLITMDR